MKRTHWSTLTILAFIEGLAALVFYFWIPSETGRPGWLGFSPSRWLIGICIFLFLLVLLGWIIFIYSQPAKWENISQKWNGWLDSGSHIWGARVILLTGLLACIEAFLLSFLSFPIHLRPLILWIGLLILESLIGSFWFYKKPVHFWSAWQSLSKQQRLILITLCTIGLVFFCLIIPQNLHGAETPHIFNVAVNDENVTYPPVLWMLKLAGKPEEWIYGLIVYEDYHYGYPFYFLSALVLLPVRLISGPNFGEQTQLNLLLLRQLVSSLPILLSSLLLVWMNTRFRSWWQSILLFLLILFIPNAAFYQIHFWHPDGLVVLAVVLTLFFLSRDHYRLDWNFFAAAIFCGLASGIKLYGFFFVLSIMVYLIFCHFDGKIGWGRITKQAAGFVFAMGICILLSNPFLGVPSARERMLQIQNEKMAQINEGYNQPGADDIYHTGLDAWLPSLEAGFGPAPFLAFLTGSLIIGSFFGQRRLLNLLTLAWVLMIGFYLIYFTAVKSQHYWLPAMLPLYGSALNLSQLDSDPGKNWFNIPPKIKMIFFWLCIFLVVAVACININATRSVFSIMIKP